MRDINSKRLGGPNSFITRPPSTQRQATDLSCCWTWNFSTFSLVLQPPVNLDNLPQFSMFYCPSFLPSSSCTIIQSLLFVRMTSLFLQPGHFCQEMGCTSLTVVKRPGVCTLSQFVSPLRNSSLLIKGIDLHYYLRWLMLTQLILIN